MPAFTLSPTGAGTYTQWTLVAGPTNWQAMGSFDGFASYIRADGALTDMYTLGNLPADAATISGNVVHTLNVADAFSFTGLTVYHYLRYSGSDYSMGGSAITPGDGALYDFAYSMASAPGGGSWTVDIVNGMEAGLQSDGVSRQLASAIQISGNYLQAGEFFVSIYNLVGPLLIGANLLYPQFQQMAQYATRWQNGRQIVHTQDEVAAAWREYKDHSYKFPSHFDLARR